MDGKALVQLALNSLSCSQKELAVRLGVSPTQISKWKKDEHMSHEMEERIRAIVKIGDMDPSFVLSAGSVEDAAKWNRLIQFLAGQAREGAETGYDTYPLADERGLLCWQTFHTLKEMGVNIPPKFPKDLDVDYDTASDDDLENDDQGLWDTLQKNEYSSAIYDIYKSLNDIYGFYTAYVADLIDDDELELYTTDAQNIEPSLMELAASKIEIAPALATNLREFKYRCRRNFEEWLNIVKDKAFRAGVPLKTELLKMVHDSHDELGHEAEAESLGFNSSRLHPDIYMNELLCGMRAIHQVLPAIMKKLGIEEEFQLDSSEFRIG